MKEVKIVTNIEWDFRFTREQLEADGWSVEQVVPKTVTRIEYEYVLVREKKGTLQ